jgi:hypothetical protein
MTQLMIMKTRSTDEVVAHAWSRPAPPPPQPRTEQVQRESTGGYCMHAKKIASREMGNSFVHSINRS